MRTSVKLWSLSLAVLVLIVGCISTARAQVSSQAYGSGLGADNLGNVVIGGPFNGSVSFRFRANHSGSLNSFNLFLIPNIGGYAAGSGGLLQVTVNYDDGTSAHNPSSSVLAAEVYSNYQNLWPSTNFPQLNFTYPPYLNAGQIYHIVFTNVDSNPAGNYLSVDALYQSHPPSLAQPTVSDNDFATLVSLVGMPFQEQKNLTPILQLDYSDGWVQGNGYMEVWYDTPEEASGSWAVREVFTVSGGDKTVTSVSVRTSRAQGNDPLWMRLEAADGTLIEEGYVAASASNSGGWATDAWGSPLNYGWVTYPFSSSHTLSSGQTYHVDFEATSTSTYLFFPIRKGSKFGFQNGSYFGDGHAEFKVNGGSWNAWTEWGQPNRMDGDLQFYFSLQ